MLDHAVPQAISFARGEADRTCGVAQMAVRSLLPSIRYAKFMESCVGISGAEFIGSSGHIAATFAQRDARQDTTIQFERRFHYHSSASSLVPTAVASSPVAHQLASISPSGSLRAVVSEVKDEAGGKRSSRIEIFSGARRVDSVNLKDIHGPVYTNGAHLLPLASLRAAPSLTGLGAGYLQNVCWSSDERLLLYVAEKKRVEAKPFWEAEAKALDAERGIASESAAKGAEESEADAEMLRRLGTGRRLREDWCALSPSPPLSPRQPSR